MIDAIKKLFGFGPSTNYTELVKQGAIIVDVKNKAIITCCASGMRSASAKGILKSKGYTSVYNGGGWSSLNNKLR